MKNNGNYIKRCDFLNAIFKTYEEDTTDYLVALRDALTLMILFRVNPSSSKPLEDYEGFIKYA